jgi:hypothetical protein
MVTIFFLFSLLEEKNFLLFIFPRRGEGDGEQVLGACSQAHVLHAPQIAPSGAIKME